MPHKPAPITALYTGGAFAVMGAVALITSPMTSGFAFLWPSTALLVARMNHRPMRDWPWLVGMCMAMLAGLLALHGAGPRTITSLVGIDTLEALGAAAMMRRLLGRGGGQGERALPSEEIGWLVRVIFGVSLLPSLIGGLVIWVAMHRSPLGWIAGRDWFLGHALGMMILLPCFARMQRLQNHYRVLADRLARGWTWQDVAATGFPALMAAVAILSFAMSTRPLLFLPVLVLVAAMLWVELFTLTSMYLVLGAISASMTVRGFSPLALMHVTMTQQLASAQVYLLLTVACVSPISGLVRQVRRSLGELRESEARYRLLADNSTDIIMSSGLEGRTRFVSPSILKLCQRNPADMIGQRALMLVSPEHRRRVAEAYLRAVASPGATVVVEFAGICPIGAAPWFEAHLRAVADQRGDAECVVSVIRDMSQRKEMESALTEAAFTDALTGLPNRRALMDAMNACIASGRQGCVAVIDLDHFKNVNDTFGHSAGDEVLRSFGHVARQGLRATDMLARIGGEEFALLLPGADLSIAERICKRIGATLARTITRHGDSAISVTSSMGLAALGSDPDQALDVADKALYIAKARGRARLQVAA